VQDVLSVVGLNFIDYVAASNQAFFVIEMKPFDQRTTAQSVDAVLARLRPQLAAIQGAIVFPFNLPPIFGLGNTGGFQYVLEGLQGQKPTEVAAVMRGLIVAANQPPSLSDYIPYSVWCSVAPPGRGLSRRLLQGCLANALRDRVMLARCGRRTARHFRQPAVSRIAIHALISEVFSPVALTKIEV
jgi:hypothetical protein